MSRLSVNTEDPIVLQILSAPASGQVLPGHHAEDNLVISIPTLSSSRNPELRIRNLLFPEKWMRDKSKVIRVLLVKVKLHHMGPIDR